MEPRYRIRRARPGDVAALPAIERAAAALFAPFPFADVLRESATPLTNLHEAQRAGRLLVAADPRDVPVGFATLTQVDGQAHLDELDVHPHHGRRGLGTALVRAACAWGERADARAITLVTFRDVPWNAPFYARLGFRLLAPDELTAGLQRLLATEAARGLPVDQRVVMRRDLPSRPARTREDLARR